MSSGDCGSGSFDGNGWNRLGKPGCVRKGEDTTCPGRSELSGAQIPAWSARCAAVQL